MALLTGCGHVQSLSVNGTHSPDGTIGASVTVVFKAGPPAPDLAAQLTDAGFVQAGPETFRIVGTMRTLAAEQALRAAVLAGGTVIVDAPRPRSHLHAPPVARHPLATGVWVNNSARPDHVPAGPSFSA